MTIQDGLFTSESVAAGHPDKVCDLISDTILDAFLARDPEARVACETFAADGKVLVAGEFRTSQRDLFEEVRSSVPKLVRNALGSVGYASADYDMDPAACEIEVRFNRQSPEIASGVDGLAAGGPQGASVIGAGDQGQMFGYATDEGADLMPRAWSLANDLVACGQAFRCAGGSPLRGDGKAQVTVRYRDGRFAGIETIVLSWQHAPEASIAEVRDYLARYVVESVAPARTGWRGPRILLNPAGAWTIGGPKGDTGLTGRKIIVDTYGGACPHGGGAFSGKDPSKVDRSGAYAARYLARHVVAARLARKCTVQLAYAIGRPEPVSLGVSLHGTGIVADRIVQSAISETFDLTPAGIIRELNLQRPIYAETSSLGHFGRHRDPVRHLWETNPRVEVLATSVTSAVRRRRHHHAPTQPVPAAERPSVRLDESVTIQERLEELRSLVEGRGPMRADAWATFHQLLGRFSNSLEGGQVPMLYIHGGHVSDEQRIMRTCDQLVWASQHGALANAEAFIHALPNQDWQNGNDTVGRSSGR